MMASRWLVVSALVGCQAPAVAPPPAPTPRPVAPPFRIRCDVAFAPEPHRDPSPMCWVPPGEFVMGAPYEEARPQDGKPRRVRITRGFYLDQYEVTVEQFARFMRVEGKRCLDGSCYRTGNPLIDISNDSILVRPGSERLPIDFVPLPVAADYCTWVGKRVPTEAQWELAARHDPNTAHARLYPWGDDYEHGVTNCGRDRCTDGFDDVSPVGTFPKDRSPIGAFDMGGNVSEWVNDCYRKDFDCDPCIDPSITSGCERVCSEFGRKSQCYDQASLQRGGDVASEPLKAKARLQALGEVGGGIRCATGPRDPP